MSIYVTEPIYKAGTDVLLFNGRTKNFIKAAKIEKGDSPSQMIQIEGVVYGSVTLGNGAMAWRTVDGDRIYAAFGVTYDSAVEKNLFSIWSEELGFTMPPGVDYIKPEAEKKEEKGEREKEFECEFHIELDPRCGCGLHYIKVATMKKKASATLPLPSEAPPKTEEPPKTESSNVGAPTQQQVQPQLTFNVPEEGFL